MRDTGRWGPMMLAALVLGGCAAAPSTVPSLPQVPAPSRVALALGGGGARSLAELGVLRVLEQEKIPIHLVVGTSVGSLVGALYADSGRVLDAEFHALAVQEEDFFDVRALAIFSGGLVKGERLRKLVATHVKAASIEDMAVPGAAPRSPLGVAYHAVALMAAEIGRRTARAADVVLEPQVGDVDDNDFAQKKLIEAGEDAARAALPAIRAALARRENVRL